MKTIKYKDYYPPAKLRTLRSLLEVYKNNSDIADEARDKLFGSRAALAKELGAIFFDSQNDQTFANKIDSLVGDVSANKGDDYLKKLWFTKEDYPKLWWSLVYFINKYPLRPELEETTSLDDYHNGSRQEPDEGTTLLDDSISPEGLVILIDKQVIPAVRIMLKIADEIGENRFGLFCKNAIEIADTSLKQYERYVAPDELNELLDLWKENHLLYYLALAICIVKKFKLVRKNGIDIDNVIERMEQARLLTVIFDDENQQATILNGLKPYIPKIKTTWQACTILAYIIHTQQLIK